MKDGKMTVTLQVEGTKEELDKILKGERNFKAEELKIESETEIEKLCKHIDNLWKYFDDDETRISKLPYKVIVDNNKICDEIIELTTSFLKQNHADFSEKLLKTLKGLKCKQWWIKAEPLCGEFTELYRHYLNACLHKDNSVDTYRKTHVDVEEAFELLKKTRKMYSTLGGGEFFKEVFDFLKETIVSAEGVAQLLGSEYIYDFGENSELILSFEGETIK